MTQNLRELIAAATPGPWTIELDWNEDGEYGPGSDPGRGFWDHTIVDGQGRSLFDSANSTAKCIEEEWPDEDGHVNAWDATGKANAALIVAAVNALPALLDELDALRVKVAEAREVVEMLRAHEALKEWGE